MMYEHGRTLAVMVGEEPPIAAVIYHRDDPDRLPYDSGFDILFSDAPEDEAELASAKLTNVCLHCLIEDHPEVGRGLDLALQHGAADRDPETGEWIGDAS